MKPTNYDWMKSGYTMVPNIIFNRFHQLNLSSDEFLLILYLLSQLNQSQSVDEMSKIANQLGWSSTKLFETLNSLMDKNYLSIELVPDKFGKHSDHYSLRPFFEQLDEKYFQAEEVKFSVPVAPSFTADVPTESIVNTFEREFGRTLTPLELETLNAWVVLDKYPTDLIKLALKEAVIHQAISLKYIDKILLTWEKKNIRTANEAQREMERYQDKQQNKQAPPSNTTPDSSYDRFQIPLYDWHKKD